MAKVSPSALGKKYMILKYNKYRGIGHWQEAFKIKNKHTNDTIISQKSSAYIFFFHSF